MRKSTFKWIILLIIIALLVVCVLGKMQTTPLEIVSNARLGLLSAEKHKASKYSKELYKKAKIYLDSAMLTWSYENNFFFNRNYQKVERYAEKSALYSQKAIIQSVENKLRIENNIKFRISRIKKQIFNMDQQYGHFPFNEKTAGILANVKMKINEILIKYKQGQYLEANQRLDSIEFNVNWLTQNYESILDDYFCNFSKWKEMVTKTISKSGKEHSYCIIIDKYNRECLVYYKGVLKTTYTVELGANWIGDKNCQGDKSTPEGLYKVVVKKKDTETKYYKALLINYPNAEDKQRFIFNKKNGVIKENDLIGNLIEIHGYGGKGMDWTDGCIALKNEDMDELFEFCNTGTPVTIVGSIKPIEEINNYIIR